MALPERRIIAGNIYDIFYNSLWGWILLICTWVTLATTETTCSMKSYAHAYAGCGVRAYIAKNKIAGNKQRGCHKNEASCMQHFFEV